MSSTYLFEVWSIHKLCGHDMIYFLHFSRGVELYEASPPREFMRGYCQGNNSYKQFWPYMVSIQKIFFGKNCT
jgi:hypothetical protein